MVKLVPSVQVDWQQVRQRTRSLQAWKLPKEPSSVAPPGVASNKDQDPVPIHLRTWTAWDYAAYWMSDLINATTWQIASSAMLVGLSTTDAIAIAALSAILNALPTVLCGFPGTDYHIPFPISIRATYGYYFSNFCVLSRALLGAVWFGVNCYYGLFIVTEIIAAIWPSYRNLPNHLPASSYMTTQQFVSYIIFVLVQFPFQLIPVHKLKKLFLIKAILMPPVSIAMVIWICVKAGNTKAIFSQPATVTGSARAWLWLSTLSSSTNAWLSSTINMSDFTRFSKTKRGPWAMAPTIPIVRTVYAILGVAMAGAGQELYGKLLWNPIECLSLWTGSGGRFLSFCAGCLWLLAQISTNISANSAPFGHDAMNLSPKWINVRRGSVICMLIGSWAMVPWLLVNTASKFLTFMNSYGSFVAAMVGVAMCDYLLVRRRKLDVPGLYDPHGRYRYIAGINIRAAVVQFFFMGICIPGVVNNINATIPVPEGFKRLFAINWFVNTLGPIVAYWALYKVWPDRKSLVSQPIYGVAVVDGADSDSQSAADHEKAGEEGDSKLGKAQVVEKSIDMHVSNTV
ncbi:hypothetical protein PV04_05705 [Phialophora macrospora]|uniref:NCS1 nucleoside transporter n=1 Tax=Phialophora macrospora TaxID=1851006 RepID=A0A0D2G2M5_9EURO|nr:hypothetical protein PV04_05705 [Phialophora macrospora]